MVFVVPNFNGNSIDFNQINLGNIKEKKDV